MKHTVAILLAMTSTFAVGQNIDCDAVDVNKTNSPICLLPQMDTVGATQGYVSSEGRWSPSGLVPDNSDVQITCVQTPVPQVSDSKMGFCLMAVGYILMNIAAVSTNYYGVVSWGKSRIIAERDRVWQLQECEAQQLVVDFPSNTVTLTSTLSVTGACAKRAAQRSGLKSTQTFNLVHRFGDLYPTKGLNPYMGK